MKRALVATVLALACDRNPETKTGDAKTADAKAAETKAAETTAPKSIVVPEGPVTAQTLLAFVPEKLGGADADMREVVDEALVAAAYRTPTGYINVNIALTRYVESDRLQVKGAESDEVVRNEAAGISKRGIAVGPHRALFVEYLSGSKSDLQMFLGDRINVRVSREGKVTPQELVALASELDLAGLAALAPRIPAPPPI